MGALVHPIKITAASLLHSLFHYLLCYLESLFLIESVFVSLSQN